MRSTLSPSEAPSATRTASLLVIRIATVPFDTLEPLFGEEAREAAENLLASEATRAREAEEISTLLHQIAGPAAPRELSAARAAVLQLRRAIHQGRLPDRGELVKAEPLLTSDAQRRIDRHAALASEIETLRATVDRRYAEAERRGHRSLAERVGDPLVRLGLRLVSRSLLRRAEGLAREDPSRWDPRLRHGASKALAYLGRFATKTSPNGVFCATALGEVTDGPTTWGGAPRVARLDFVLHVGEARKIAACLAASPQARASVRPRINATLRADGSAPCVWSLWRPATPRRPEDDEVRLEIKDHPVLRLFLEAAAKGAREDDVIGTVASRLGRDVGPFYSQLVERGVLIGEVEIPWSERRPLRALADACPSAPWATELHDIESTVEALATAPMEQIPERLDAVTARLEALPHARPLAPDDLIRCDAACGLGGTLSRPLLGDLERLIPLYARFYGAIYPEPLTRETFAARFLKRYPADTPIPVLDFYHGLFEPVAAPRPSAFTSASIGPADSPRRRAAGAAFSRAREAFARRAREAAMSGRDEMELTEADWVEIAGDAPEPRFACGALIQVAASSIPSTDSDARICLNALYPGAGISVARLAHLHASSREADNPIARGLAEGWGRQARPGAEFAEITFMHGGRTANAGLRPSIFSLEIELPGDRATPGRTALPLADLTATWDGAAERFVLRSMSRGTEILPVISSGINPEGFISFLTMVGGQDLQPLGLLAGFDLPEIRVWPRFRFGNVVLFRRRWVFDVQELPRGASGVEHYLAMQRWRVEHALPIHVFVHTDREPKPFYVHLGSPAFLDLLRRFVDASRDAPGARKESASDLALATRMHVTEMLPGPDDLWVRDEAGHHASEFLVHLDNLGDPG